MMKKLRTTDFRGMKERGEKIAMITAYDAAIAAIVDAAGVDVVLVGDSLGNVVQGLEDTLSVTLDEMIYHTRIVSRGVERAHLCSDMPFLSYQKSPEDAVESAGRLLKEGRAESVKLEVNDEYVDTVYRIQKAGIPVIAHIGLCPQSVHVMGGYKVQGTLPGDREVLLDLSRSCEQAGAFMVVVESVVSAVAQEITGDLDIPTVGIGSGADCDGQVLVVNDMIGLTQQSLPKFVKKYADVARTISDSTKKYVEEVKREIFPSSEYFYE
ncbi:MAG: 3-methyl-2-oxobutanoate hydroxymethyltransferase [Candidatus Dadabacteria bacterium]|nr:3-methyl-2-oxobutanoate hydroxymethyltransferase [Candidatus Dadabacteria bacterium]MCY4262254.1 3-methyl-2-oxobutanoate hydroxymethyltransferase [Candidatus Dadabacteria bacterium]